MAEKRMLILPAEVVQKIDDNRGDLSQVAFIEFLIDSLLEQKTAEERFATHEDLADMEQDIKGLIRNFLDFVVSYGLELGHDQEGNGLESLSQKLQVAGTSREPTHRSRKATEE